MMITHSNLALDSILSGLLAVEQADISSSVSPIRVLRFGSRVFFFYFFFVSFFLLLIVGFAT